jgi:hypothetical protein
MRGGATTLLNTRAPRASPSQKAGDANASIPIFKTLTCASPNGPHLRPHAGLSARGRAAPEKVPPLPARGRALYVSRRAACVCYAAVVRERMNP